MSGPTEASGLTRSLEELMTPRSNALLWSSAPPSWSTAPSLTSTPSLLPAPPQQSDASTTTATTSSKRDRSPYPYSEEVEQSMRLAIDDDESFTSFVDSIEEANHWSLFQYQNPQELLMPVAKGDQDPWPRPPEQDPSKNPAALTKATAAASASTTAPPSTSSSLPPSDTLASQFPFVMQFRMQQQRQEQQPQPLSQTEQQSLPPQALPLARLLAPPLHLLQRSQPPQMQPPVQGNQIQMPPQPQANQQQLAQGPRIHVPRALSLEELMKQQQAQIAQSRSALQQRQQALHEAQARLYQGAVRGPQLTSASPMELQDSSRLQITDGRQLPAVQGQARSNGSVDASTSQATSSNKGCFGYGPEITSINDMIGTSVSLAGVPITAPPATSSPTLETTKNGRKRTPPGQGEAPKRRNSVAKRRMLDTETGDVLNSAHVGSTSGGPMNEVEQLLSQLSKNEVSMHVYENAQRAYLRFNKNGVWQMRDLTEFIPISFHIEGSLGAPIPRDQMSASTPTQRAQRPTTMPDKDVRSLNLTFKRKEHYWRRGIWVRVVVDVVSRGAIVRDAGGSINVELFSLRGEPVRKACEKCSKYYFRYKNMEANGEQAPAFEIEEADRNTAVLHGRASFNMRIWECSHHYLSPHTLAFSWINPSNPAMKVEAVSPKEIVISSGSGQEKKLRDMHINTDELFKDFIDALIMMDEGKYSQAIESLRCIRWKAYHFVGAFIATCVDEKIADCYLRTGNYVTAIHHFNRTLNELTHLNDRISASLVHYMKALLYLKIANCAYYKERETGSVNFEKAHRSLERSCNAIKQAKELEPKDAPNVVHDFARHYLKYAYYQDLMGLCLMMKPFESKGDPTDPDKLIMEAFRELERNYSSFEEDKLWSGPEVTKIFEPLATKLHITVDKLKMLLHSPLLTNQAITRRAVAGKLSTTSDSSPTTSSASSSAPSPQDEDAGPASEDEGPLEISTSSSDNEAEPSTQFSRKELVLAKTEILRNLQQATKEAEELHPKGHRTICISRCLSALFTYLSGDMSSEEALRRVEETWKEIEQFWVNERMGGKFECEQFASIVNWIRNESQRDQRDPECSLFDGREDLHLYRLWIHSPLDVICWATLQPDVHA